MSSTLAGLRLDRDLVIRLALFAIGFSPIASLSLSTFNLIPLHISGPLVVAPAIVCAFILAALFPRYRSTMVKGLLLGIVAVTLYDMTRFPFVAAGLWKDFIPKIGNYLLNKPNVHWSVGYLWRYLGNGGGMGLAFYSVYPLVNERIMPLKPVRTGVLYGIGVFCCLLITVFMSPSGFTYLFKPSVFTGTLGFIGHVVYGYVLGVGVRRYPDRSNVITMPAVAPVAAHAAVRQDSYGT